MPLVVMSIRCHLPQTLSEVHLEYMRCSFGLCVVCVACEATDPTPYTTGRDSTLGRCRLQSRETVVTSRPANANWSDLKPTARNNINSLSTIVVLQGVIPPTPLVERPPGRRLGSSETLLPTLVAERTISALPVPTDFHNDVGTPED